MTKFQIAYNKTWKWALLAMFATGLVIFAVSPAFAGRGHKFETIDANAMGTSTQLGQIVPVQIEIYELSTPEDRQFLIQAFEKGQNRGLVNALTKMKAVGHCSITGTLGYDVAFIEVIPTPTGRKIRFVTNRRIEFGEMFFDTRSKDYNVTAGEIEINDSDKKKSAGSLFPAAQLVINKEGQLEFQLLRNPWKLVNIIDWDKAGTPLE
jgi:hypothetical protein